MGKEILQGLLVLLYLVVGCAGVAVFLGFVMSIGWALWLGMRFAFRQTGRIAGFVWRRGLAPIGQCLEMRICQAVKVLATIFKPIVPKAVKVLFYPALWLFAWGIWAFRFYVLGLNEITPQIHFLSFALSALIFCIAIASLVWISQAARAKNWTFENLASYLAGGACFAPILVVMICVIVGD